MATVILPMGYPLQSGQQFDTIVYQGVVARSYVLPKDPRTDAQIMQRRLTYDVTKMRSTIGLWGRAVLKIALGSKWGSVLFQLVKADVNSWWSDAIIEWESFTEQDKEEWRSAAPFQATYNDVGLIFFCLVRVVWRAMTHYSGESFRSAEWDANQSADAVAWWNSAITNVFYKGKYDDRHAFLEYSGSWIQSGQVFTYLQTLTACVPSTNRELSFYCKARTLTFVFEKGVTYGNFDVFVDGNFKGSLLQKLSSGGDMHQQEQVFDLFNNSLHFVKVRSNQSGALNVDAIEVS